MAVQLRMRLTACTLLAMAATALSSAMPSESSAAPATKKAAVVCEVPVSNPRGQILALSCSSCHGTDGKSVGIIPPIHGKSVDYIESALKDFKSGARVSTVMSRHAKGYSDEEITLIAQYFGSLSRKK